MAKLSANGDVLARLTRLYHDKTWECTVEKTKALMLNGKILVSTRTHGEYGRPGTWTHAGESSEDWREKVLRMVRSGRWILSEGSFPELEEQAPAVAGAAQPDSTHI